MIDKKMSEYYSDKELKEMKEPKTDKNIKENTPIKEGIYYGYKL